MMMGVREDDPDDAFAGTGEAVPALAPVEDWAVVVDEDSVGNTARPEVVSEDEDV